LDLIVNDFLVPIKHLGVEINTYKSIETSGEYAGHNNTKITFNFEKFDSVDGKTNTYVKDKRVWELLCDAKKSYNYHLMKKRKINVFKIENNK
jgi:hypothetical protein